MELRFSADDEKSSSVLSPASKSSYFAEQALRAGFISNDIRRNDLVGNPVDVREAILQREIEKERIREEIIAAEVVRRRILEAEVRRELQMERELAMREFSLRASSTMRSDLRIDETLPLQTSREITVSDSLPFQRPETRVSEVKPVSEISNGKVLFMAKSMFPSLAGTKRKATALATGANLALAVVSKKKTQQKEWSCALCKVSATSEQGLNDHLKGKKHKAREAELRKNSTSKSTGNCTTSSKKTDKNVKTTGSSNLKQGKLLQVKKNGESPEKKKQKAEGTKGKEDAPVQKKKKTEDAKKKKLEAAPPQKKKLTAEMKKKKFKFWCEMCQIGAYGEAVMEAHRKGKKHMAKSLKLKQKDVAGPAMTTQDATSKKSEEMENVDREVDALTEADREEAGGELAEADATRERPSSKDEGIDGSAASLVSGSKNSPTDQAGQST